MTSALEIQSIFLCSHDGCGQLSSLHSCDENLVFNFVQAPIMASSWGVVLQSVFPSGGILSNSINFYLFLPREESILFCTSGAILCASQSIYSK